jgi:hypothetical protein
LNGYVAAEALINIGGREAANAVIDHLKEPRTERELLLCAQVLYRNDALEITFERLRLAAERAKGDEAMEHRDMFLRNLAQMKEWLGDPNFERDERYLPK